MLRAVIASGIVVLGSISGCGRVGFSSHLADAADGGGTTTDGGGTTTDGGGTTTDAGAMARLDGMAVTSDGAAAWWNADWTHRLHLSFDTEGITETLTDVPVLVRLDASRIDYAVLQPNGEDVRFVDDPGQELDHEIERWDPDGVSTVWVRVPSLDEGVWLYYGNEVAADTQRPAPLWRTSGHAAVWHLGGDVTGSPDEVPDSTGASREVSGGNGIPTQLPVSSEGRAGGGQTFDGIDDTIVIHETADLNFTTAAITIEAWLHYPEVGSTLCHVAKAGYSQGFRMCLASDGRVIFQLTGETYTLYSEARPPVGAWHYVVGVWDGVEMRLYIDGVLDPETLPRPGMLDPAPNNVVLGHGSQTTGEAWSYPLSGVLDEVRISNQPRSGDWVETQYRSTNGALVIFE